MAVPRLQKSHPEELRASRGCQLVVRSCWAAVPGHPNPDSGLVLLISLGWEALREVIVTMWALLPHNDGVVGLYLADAGYSISSPHWRVPDEKKTGGGNSLK